MKRVHYIDNYLLNPQHPVTVNLIGAGGTGSQVLTCLARLDVSDGCQHRSPAFRLFRPWTEQGAMPDYPSEQFLRQ